MRTLHIDIETYCDLDVGKCGVYRYAEHPSFEVILLAFAWDDGEPQIIERPGRGLTPELFRALTDPRVRKIAHNANFEITCLSAWTGLRLQPAHWKCTMVGAAYLGLPLSLDKVSEVLCLDERKDARGKALINYFCKPCRPTKANGGRTRNLPEHAPEKWGQFCEYCVQDVRTEQAIHDYLQRFPQPTPWERTYWEQDQEINGRGIRVDEELARTAIAANTSFVRGVHEEIQRLTGVANPNSLPQLKAWISEQLGAPVGSLGREALEELPAEGALPDDVARVLALRRLASNTSVTKYDAMLSFMCGDGRIRGLLQFYGANRTGRFAGRGVQIQNLKRTLKNGLDATREAVRTGYADLLFDDLSEVLSRITRTALVAAPGNLLCVADYSAIEARVIAWLAGEEWVLEVFRTHGKIYEAAAAQMFHLPIDMIGKGSDLRAKGKVATLALGYQGGVGALVAMGAVKMGIDEAELPAIVRAWRSANPAIVKLWRSVEQAARLVIERKTTYTLRLPATVLRFTYDRGYLFIGLPSGRVLSYFGSEASSGKLSYMGMEQATRQWRRTDTYGGSLVENIVQAIARDCLCDAMLRMEVEHDTRILMHIHDEVVAEAPAGEAEAALQNMYAVMAVPPVWAPTLPLRGDGYISEYYKKD